MYLFICLFFYWREKQMVNVDTHAGIGIRLILVD